MNKVRVLLLVALLLALTPMISSADVPAPGGPFNTAFRVQNLSNQVATCVVQFFGAGGTPAASLTLPAIAVGDSAYVYVPSIASLTSGQYSAVVSCDQETAAVVNFSDVDSGASYNAFGATSVANVLYAPASYDNYYGFYSSLVVQNASAGAVNITLEVFAPGSTTPVLTDTRANVPANGFVTFEQEGQANLATNVSYSAKISSTGAIAAVATIYGRGAVASQLYSYDAFAAGATTAYAPVIMSKFFGYNTALVIQNMGTQSADVTITYGTGLVKTTTIGPGASDSRYTPGEGLPDGTLTGATVQSTNAQPLVVIVNESTNMNRAATYEGFLTGSTTVRAPIVMKKYFKYNTSVTCQNVGAAAATMTVAYSGIAGSQATAAAIPVGGTHLFYQPGDALLAGQASWIGSATITSAQPIVCVVNEDMNEAPDVNMSKDMLFAYDGIGQ